MMAESDESPARRVALWSEDTDLVRIIVYQFFRRRDHVDFAALIQADVVGLCAAMTGHERDTAEVFEAYASGQYVQAERRATREKDRPASLKNS
jgi:hypothetical protein